MQLVILAGGKGTRLGLKDLPKPMYPIAGRPLLERQIELARSYGINEIFILSGFKGDVIQNYFGDGNKWGVKIHHVIEPYPRGTAGSLKALEGRLEGRFMVFYGDVVMDLDLQAFMDFDAGYLDTVGTLIVHPSNHPYDSDLIEIDERGEVTGFLPKPHPAGMIYRNLANAAVYIFSPRVLDYIEPGKMQDFGKDILPNVLRVGGRLRAYRTPEYIRDMGTRDRLAVIERDIASGEVARRNRANPRRAIFLDRDGTLNIDMGSRPRAEALSLLPGVADAVRRINESGLLAICVTNQPMIAKGFVTQEEVETINMKLETLLGNEQAYLDALYYCPHHQKKGFSGEVPELKIDCECRKPKPGMLIRAAEDLHIDLAGSWMVGDREVDVEAGHAAGCRALLLGREVSDLAAAVDFILAEDQERAV